MEALMISLLLAWWLAGVAVLVPVVRYGLETGVFERVREQEDVPFGVFVISTALSIALFAWVAVPMLLWLLVNGDEW